MRYISGDVFFFSSRGRHTRYWRDWSSDVCSSDLDLQADARRAGLDQLARRLAAERQDPAASRTTSRAAADELRQLQERLDRAEERRVGKECRCRWSPDH